MHSLFLDTEVLQVPPQYFPWHTIEGSLKVDTGKVGCNVLFLQLSSNEDGFSITSTRQKAEPHLIDVHHFADVEVSHPFQQLHDLICEPEFTTDAMAKGLTLAFMDVQDEAFPFCWGLHAVDYQDHAQDCHLECGNPDTNWEKSKSVRDKTEAKISRLWYAGTQMEWMTCIDLPSPHIWKQGLHVQNLLPCIKVRSWKSRHTVGWELGRQNHWSPAHLWQNLPPQDDHQ